MNYIQFLCFFSLSFGGTALGNIESCTEEPALVLDAGSELSMKIRNAFGARCSAELVFANELPSMTWYFEPAECVGSQLAQFSIPFDVPNGNAYITWQCEEEGTMSCNRIVISKGSPVLTATPRLITETARCMSLTTFMTHVLTPDMGNLTGVFQDITPVATDTVSTPLSGILDIVVGTTSTPVTLKRPLGYKTLIGIGETRKTDETSARLRTDMPALTTTTSVNRARTTPFPTTTTITSPITNTATVTVPVVIPIPDSTTVSTGEITNERTYITVISTISACLTPMKL
ncbi:hypothetical protein FSST1_011131 [Fusarium sambucinum]